MKIRAFEHKSPDFDKLAEFGFSFDGASYSHAVKIMSGQFEMRVVIPVYGDITTEVIDLCTGEPYSLHLVAEAGGAFVGAVRTDYERVLTEISEKCFYKDVFKSEQARRVIKYVRQKYGDELQYLWQKFPTDAVWRRQDNSKWYGALLVLSKRKLGLHSDEIVDILDLRIDPERLNEIVDGEKYFRGYHMNKKNWVTVCLDGSLPIEEVFSLIDKSYVLAEKG